MALQFFYEYVCMRLLCEHWVFLSGVPVEIDKNLNIFTSLSSFTEGQ